jgi:hypothetical protein
MTSFTLTGYAGLTHNAVRNVHTQGGAITQAVSRWLLTEATRVRSRVRSFGICGGQSGAGAGFLQVFLCPLPIFILPIAPHSPSSIVWGWYNRPEVAAVQADSVSPLYEQCRYKTNPLSRESSVCSSLPFRSSFTVFLIVSSCYISHVLLSFHAKRSNLLITDQDFPFQNELF